MKLLNVRAVGLQAMQVFKQNMVCVLFILLSLVAACNGQNGTAPSDTEAFAKIEKITTDGLKDLNIPSIAIGIVLDGKVVYAKGFGFADKENKKLADANTIYQLGSVTKTFTGNLLARLIVEKKISLEDPLSKFFPETLKFPTDKSGHIITIKDIATHSAEFPRYPDNLDRIDGDPLLGFTKEQLYTGIELVRIENPIGVHYSYSNFGYGVLGTALENLTHKSLGDLFNQRILHPLHMKSSSLRLSDTIKARLAVAYRKDDPNQKTSAWDMGSMSAAGNMFSSVNDMGLFMIEMLKNSEVNKVQQTGYLRINDTWSYGLGCFPIASKTRNTKMIHHGGDLDSFASYLILYPEFNSGLIVLTNSGVRGFGDMAEEINGVVFTDLIRKEKLLPNKEKK